MRVSICILHAIYWIIPIGVGAQTRQIDLSEAIRLAQENSYAYKVAKNRWQSSVWHFRNFQTSFYPTLYLDGTIPNYDRAINRITLPTGEDTFVRQNQAYSSLNLSVRQNVGLTGGVFSVGSSLNRIDVFGDNRQRLYSSAPFSISYSQHAIGYNPFKWEKKIEPLRFEASQRQFVSDMERISYQTVEYYFQTLSSQERLRLSRQNLANADTLYDIAQERFRLGNVDQSDLLQLRLNTLNARKQLTQDSVDFVLSKQHLTRYLLIPNEVNLIAANSVQFFDIDYDQVLSLALDNSEDVVNFRLQRLEAEQRVAETNAQNGLRFNVQANFGVTNRGQNIGALLRGMESQQQIALGFSIPILDWGYAKTQRLRSEANLAMVENEVQQKELQLEQEVALHTARWNLHKQQLEVAQEARNIAHVNFELQIDRFRTGMVSINDLNIAQEQKDQAENNYIHTQQVYWELYYTIRRITLYDFQKSKMINYIFD